MYKNILAEMARRGLTKSDVAKAISCSEATFRQKIRGKQDFKVSEINALLSLFGNLQFEYLFSTEANV